MEQCTRIRKVGTPIKCPHDVRSKVSENSNSSENSNPNVSTPRSGRKLSNSPQLVKSSGKVKKSASRNPNVVLASPRNRIRERKFVVAKKKSKKNDEVVRDVAANPDCKCKDKVGGKCLCLAYETLRTSQEEFSKSWKDVEGVSFDDCVNQRKSNSVNEERSDETLICVTEGAESPKGSGTNSTVKRSRDKVREEVRQSMPEPGSGRVLNLVHAFEKILTIPNDSDEKKEEEPEDSKKEMRWDSSSPFCPEDLVLTAQNLGLCSRVSSSIDSGRGSSRRSSAGSLRSRRSGSTSLRSVGGRNSKMKQPKATSQKPFKLRTEERGKEKEEEFLKKLQEMMIQEEKQRIPIAQGLPWTTDEPEIPAKPAVKESTRPLDIKLHTDLRAVDRAEYDNQVAEKLSWIEQYKMERERQQKLAEEEEIKRLRKELVPKAQPMPYFDRPFIPKRSEKQPTIPKDPKFHIPNHKRSCLSWNDFNHDCAHQQ